MAITHTVTQDEFDGLVKAYKKHFTTVKTEVTNIRAAMQEIVNLFNNAEGAISANLNKNWLPELKELNSDVTKRIDDLDTAFAAGQNAFSTSVTDATKAATLEIKRSLFGTSKDKYQNINVSGS